MNRIDSSYANFTYGRRPFVIVFGLLIGLFLFSNLLTRFSGINFNVAFYVVWGIAVGYVLLFWRWNILYLAASLLAIYCSTYPLIVGEGYYVAAAAAKDVAIPISAVILGYAIGNDPRVINTLNRLFTPFVVYGVIQAAVFYLGEFESYLPWDHAYLQSARKSGISNLFQEELLRFFGTMNAFWEYQLLVVLIPLYLWTQIEVIRGKTLFAINVAMALAFLVVTVERTPLLLLACMVIIITVLSAGRRMKMLLLASFLVLATVVFSIVTGVVPTENADALQRLKNIVTLNFKDDSSVMDRVGIWSDGIRLIQNSPLTGVGLGLVLPSLEGRGDSHFSPHNGYIFLLVGYGIFGAALFFVFLSWLVWRIGWCYRSENAFALALVASMLVIGIFHIPWVGRLGDFLFLVLGIANSRYQSRRLLQIPRYAVNSVRLNVNAA